MNDQEADTLSTPVLKHERRRFPRAITSLSGVLSLGTQTIRARIVNLSMGGALLDLGDAKATPAIQLGDRLSLEIACRGGIGPVSLEGKAVMWNKSVGSIPLLAVQFDEVLDDRAEILEDLMFQALSKIQQRHAGSFFP